MEIDHLPITAAGDRRDQIHLDAQVPCPLGGQFVGGVAGPLAQHHVPPVADEATGERRAAAEKLHRRALAGGPRRGAETERHARTIGCDPSGEGGVQPLDPAGVGPRRRGVKPERGLAGAHKFAAGREALHRHQSLRRRQPQVHPGCRGDLGGERESGGLARPGEQHLGLLGPALVAGGHRHPQLLRHRHAVADERPQVEEARAIGRHPHRPITQAVAFHAHDLARPAEIERYHLRLALVDGDRQRLAGGDLIQRDPRSHLGGGGKEQGDVPRHLPERNQHERFAGHLGGSHGDHAHGQNGRARQGWDAFHKDDVIGGQ